VLNDRIYTGYSINNRGQQIRSGSAAFGLNKRLTKLHLKIFNTYRNVLKNLRLVQITSKDTSHGKMEIKLLFVYFVLVVGPISTAAMKAYCTLTPLMEFRHSSLEALHTKRRESPLLAKDVTKTEKFS
jgi:hypothetical protein